jgi:hypothetical protein
MVEAYIDEAARGPSLKAPVRRKANKEIMQRLGGKSHFPAVPLDEIFDALAVYDIVPVQEDGTRWSGLLTGRKGRATIDLAPAASKTPDGIYTPYTNTMLVIEWYKMEDSGSIEVTTYVS